ncbi:uncharacterized protein LOC122397639 [Colletes gigas]|uniref:uncharacterized protein LOC122397639 n=1 Tax=Colletes gigas TaxID=935657 RepID=UPI001C9B12DE|nr:uncharacterized protein LOC122397639 [Colletes gigas]
MLGLIFRGVFLIGILTWYSTNVWKLIDSYFRDQFRSYLEEEYRKNPRMKSDVQGVSVDKIDPVPVESPQTTVEPPRDVTEVFQPEACTVEAAENDSAIVEPNREEDVTGGTSENKAAGGSTDKNAFLGTTAESELESRKSTDDEQESRRPINHDDRDLEEAEKKKEDRRSVSAVSKNTRKRAKRDKKPTVSRDISRDNRSPRTRNVKTITLTETDFMSATINDESNDDFWEFEEDAVEKEPLEGILISELPFKPRADIGHLERVTADEYCPLTLEDEATCGDTAKWP